MTAHFGSKDWISRLAVDLYRVVVPHVEHIQDPTISLAKVFALSREWPRAVLEEEVTYIRQHIPAIEHMLKMALYSKILSLCSVTIRGEQLKYIEPPRVSVVGFVLRFYNALGDVLHGHDVQLTLRHIKDAATMALESFIDMDYIARVCTAQVGPSDDADDADDEEDSEGGPEQPEASDHDDHDDHDDRSDHDDPRSSVDARLE